MSNKTKEPIAILSANLWVCNAYGIACYDPQTTRVVVG